MFNLVAIGTVAMSLLAGPTVAPRPAESTESLTPSGKIQVQVVSVIGSGCRLGTAAVAAAPDNTAFTVTYSDFMAQVGPRSRPTDLRKNCQMGVQVTFPQGFTFAIAEADYRGFAHLAAGASAIQRANYYFQGMSQNAYSTHPFSGPYNNVWQATDVAAVLSLVYAPCGDQRIVNINTELVVDEGSSSPAATSFMTMDSTDGSVNTIFHLAWKRC